MRPSLGKKLKSNNNSAIKRKLLFYNHLSDFGDFSIFTTSNKGFKVSLMKNFLINRDQSLLLLATNEQGFTKRPSSNIIKRQYIDCKLFIQHLVFYNEFCIYRNVGKTKKNLVTSNDLLFL